VFSAGAGTIFTIRLPVVLSNNSAQDDVQILAERLSMYDAGRWQSQFSYSSNSQMSQSYLKSTDFLLRQD
jgi:hypothetical protein